MLVSVVPPAVDRQVPVPPVLVSASTGVPVANPSVGFFVSAEKLASVAAEVKPNSASRMPTVTTILDFMGRHPFPMGIGTHPIRGCAYVQRLNRWPGCHAAFAGKARGFAS